MTYKSRKSNLIQPHGGYRKLKSFQSAEIVFDLTKIFCEKFLNPSHRSYKSYESYESNKTYKSYRQIDQMIQAARSGKQNIAEGSMASGTSKKTELKLIGVARASLEELLVDFEDFLRNNGIQKWSKGDPRVLEIRSLAYKSNRSYKTYMTYFKNSEGASNILICLINQTNFLLDRQLKSLEQNFLEEGGFTERLYRTRKSYRSY